MYWKFFTSILTSAQHFCSRCSGRDCHNKFLHLLGKQGSFNQKPESIVQAQNHVKDQVTGSKDDLNARTWAEQKDRKSFPLPLGHLQVSAGGRSSHGSHQMVRYSQPKSPQGLTENWGEHHGGICSFLNAQCNLFVLLIREPRFVQTCFARCFFDSISTGSRTD